MTVPFLSVVVPMYDEELVVPAFVRRLRPVLDGLGETYEVVVVDDGSRDGTARTVIDAGRTWPELRLIELRRNGGHQAALTAGLHRARGQWVVSIDADLQDPPEVIADMLALARRQGLDVVYGVRGDRSTDTRFKRRTAGMYYRIMRRVVGVDVPVQAGDFRLISREVVDTLRHLPERTPVYRLLIPSLGFPSGQVVYTRERRAAGETKYPLRKMIALAWDSTADFTAAPLRIATWLGLTAFLACIVMIGFGVAVWAGGTTIPGWTSLFVAMLMLSAVQLVCLGLVGEYLSRIYRAVQNRPTYSIGADSLIRRPVRADEADAFDSPAPSESAQAPGSSGRTLDLRR